MLNTSALQHIPALPKKSQHHPPEPRRFLMLTKSPAVQSIPTTTPQNTSGTLAQGVQYWFRARRARPKPDPLQAVSSPPSLEVLSGVDDLTAIAVEYPLLREDRRQGQAGRDGPPSRQRRARRVLRRR